MDNFGDRMKGYEGVWDQALPSRLPVILRLDGNSFSRFTKKVGFEKPFDRRMSDAMIAGMTAVLDYCSGAVLGYTQSDEITILLRNDQTLQTTPFLANRIQKVCSLTAATCSVAFNKRLREMGMEVDDAIFDCRCFVVPPEEVTNTFLWRQQDCFKNAISAFTYYKLGEKVGMGTARKMMDGLNTDQRQELVFSELGLNCNDIPTMWKRGICVKRETQEVYVRDILDPEVYKKLLETGKVMLGETTKRSSWVPDLEIPIFSQDRNYIESLMEVTG